MRRKLTRIINIWNEQHELTVLDKLELTKIIIKLQIALDDRWSFIQMLADGSDANIDYAGVLMLRASYDD